MTIKAILRNGIIEPLEPLPADWEDGQELLVEEPQPAASRADLDEWARELEAGTAELPPAEHERFRDALGDIERESKDAVRREWGSP